MMANVGMRDDILLSRLVESLASHPIWALMEEQHRAPQSSRLLGQLVHAFPGCLSLFHYGATPIVLPAVTMGLA